MVLKCFDTLDGCIIQAEEVLPEFSQAELASDDVMILDTWDQVRPSFIDSVSALLEISVVEISPNLSPFLPDLHLDWKGGTGRRERWILKNWSVYLEVKIKIK